jgi:hypothetical protein
MSVYVSLLPGAIAEIFAQTSEFGILTVADRYGLMAAVMEETLPEEERLSVDRILYSIHRGRLKVVDELSFVA